MSKREFWIETIGQGWYDFYPDLWESEYLEEVLNFVQSRYEQATVYPAKENLFRAFQACPFEECKVLILGQDPYPDGSATGLAFANPENSDKPISPSLKKIMGAVEKSVYDGFKLDFDVTLEEWAIQGVLLLNTSLTFEKYKGGHFDYWKDFTTAIVQKISEMPGMHVCLWGAHAKSFKKNINELFTFVYEDVHPAYAARQNVDWECTHFKDINMNIYDQNGHEGIIKW